jgi:hypothetical protein
LEENSPDLVSLLPSDRKTFSASNYILVVDQVAGLRHRQDCQMVSFRTKNPTLGKFWRAC